jgi:hypothetical protein
MNPVQRPLPITIGIDSFFVAKQKCLVLPKTEWASTSPCLLDSNHFNQRLYDQHWLCITICPTTKLTLHCPGPNAFRFYHVKMFLIDFIAEIPK